MKGKVDFCRQNLLFLFTSNTHPAGSSFVALRFQFVCLCGATHRGTSTKISSKKNGKEKRIDHRKFRLCSVCNSFPHSTSLLILDFRVVFFLKNHELNTYITLSFFKQTVAPGNKCSDRKNQLSGVLCGQAINIPCHFYSGA